MTGGRLKPILVPVVVATLLVTVAIVLLWFQPQRLFLDTRVDEPLATDGEVEVLASGSFIDRDHATSGRVQILEFDDRRRGVRLEDFETTNGPALRVYLSTTAAEGEEATFDDDFVDLGVLRGNEGNQAYAVPPEVDVARFASVVIWCERFDAAFGAADLTEA